jgi:regulator of replication initiation timing
MKCPLECSTPLEVSDGLQKKQWKGYIFRSEMMNHTSNLCPNSYQQCSYCEEKILLKDWKLHMETNSLHHIVPLLEENEKQKLEIQELKKRLNEIDIENKRRNTFSTSANLELEAKYTKLMEECTLIYAKDCDGEWAQAYILEILPFNNIKVGFPHYESEWDTIINTVREDYRLALDKESIPPLIQEKDSKDTKNEFLRGQEVWAACLYNGGQGTHLIKGYVEQTKNGQVLVRPNREWLEMKRNKGKSWFHVMEIQSCSTWKTKTCPNLAIPRPPSPVDLDQLGIGEIALSLLIR